MDYLQELRREWLGRAGDPPAAAGRAGLAPWIAREERFAGSLRFTAPPDATLLDDLRDLGVAFFDFGNGPAGSRTVFPARIPYAALPTLAADGRVARVECAWRPGAPPPLARSRPQVEADQAWAVGGPGGDPLTGEGVLVCDIDTGVTFFHPVFFRESGERFGWIDADLSGDLSAGDAVDLDGDGQAGAGEALRYQEALGTDQYGNVSGQFDADFDWLYNDADGSGHRDYGPADFDEADPCYGERLFLADDADGDGALDPGEELLGLGPVMVRAVMEQDGTVRRRGVDLIDAQTDTWGHGTQVTGIFGGGWAWRNAMTGMAPGVESLHVNYQFQAEPPFLVPVEAGLAWAVAEGAGVVLIEDGEWVWEYLDGSSNLEIMINELASDEGVIFIIPAGNLATGNMHTSFPAVGGTVLHMQSGASVAWPALLWTDPVDMTVAVSPPGGSPVALPGDGSALVVDSWRIWSEFSVSDRGTRRMDVRLATEPEGGSIGGDWGFGFAFPGGDVTVHGFFVDDVSGWYSASSWDIIDPTCTVTWPATADSAISVTAYNPSEDGDINGYSGWGPRIDGRPCVDLAAPGSTVASAHPWSMGDYTGFGGTSSAGPHVAGAAAILAQLMTGMDSGLCRRFLREGAAQDTYTADPDRWGSGKLRIHAAVLAALTDAAETPPPPGMGLAAWPNPFNPRVTLRFRLPAAGLATLRVFDAAGRQVWSRRLPVGDAGWRSVVWGGEDAGGRRLPSGLYFARLAQGKSAATVKLTLIK